MKRKLSYIVALCLWANLLFAQTSVELEVLYADSQALHKKYHIAGSFKSVLQLNESLEDLIHQLKKDGYLTASVDTLGCDSAMTKCVSTLFVGQKYSIESIENGNIEDVVWKKLGLHKLQPGVDLSQLEYIQASILNYYENNGFPYAQVWVDSLALQDGKGSMHLFVEPNDLITVDSLVVHGNTKTKSKFLQRYLGIESGDLFSQGKFDAIEQKLKQLPYFRSAQTPEIYFTPGEATLHVFLEKQRSNQFNLILGVLPNSELGDKKLTITGEGKLQLLNSFGVGEEIYAEFRQLKPRTQNLDIAFTYPYFLNSPIGVYGSFNLYKNDSLFIDVNTEVGILYQFGGFNRLKFFYDNQSSNILNVDSLSIKNSGVLPTTLDIRNNTYGIALELQQLDYVLNPRRGFQLHLSGGVGLNRIRVNQSIATLIAFDGNPLQFQYDSLPLKRLNYSLALNVSQFIPIRKKSTLLLRNQSKFYVAKNILENEKYRIGGYRMLRGFDEEAIYTPFYSIFTTEFRLLLSQNSYFNLFTDVGIVEDEQKGSGNIDIPVGFGVGVALETRGGIFSLSYALGRNLDNKIQVRNGKIHFGFVSLF